LIKIFELSFGGFGDTVTALSKIGVIHLDHFTVQAFNRQYWPAVTADSWICRDCGVNVYAFAGKDICSPQSHPVTSSDRLICLSPELCIHTIFPVGLATTHLFGLQTFLLGRFNADSVNLAIATHRLLKALTSYV
jgi:hypothetical protein